MNTIKLVTWSFSSFGALLIRLVGWVILLFSVYVHLECAIEYSVQERYQLCSITVACLIEQFITNQLDNLDTSNK